MRQPQGVLKDTGLYDTTLNVLQEVFKKLSPYFSTELLQ